MASACAYDDFTHVNGSAKPGEDHTSRIREYLRRLKKAFDEKGIEMPIPHRRREASQANVCFRTIRPAKSASRSTQTAIAILTARAAFFASHHF